MLQVCRQRGRYAYADRATSLGAQFVTLAAVALEARVLLPSQDECFSRPYEPVLECVTERFRQRQHDRQADPRCCYRVFLRRQISWAIVRNFHEGGYARLNPI